MQLLNPFAVTLQMSDTRLALHRGCFCGWRYRLLPKIGIEEEGHPELNRLHFAYWEAHILPFIWGISWKYVVTFFRWAAGAIQPNGACFLERVKNGIHDWSDNGESASLLYDVGVRHFENHGLLNKSQRYVFVPNHWLVVVQVSN